jgi:hypothetical protein
MVVASDMDLEDVFNLKKLRLHSLPQSLECLPVLVVDSLERSRDACAFGAFSHRADGECVSVRRQFDGAFRIHLEEFQDGPVDD